MMKITLKPLKSLFVLFLMVGSAAFAQEETVSDAELQNFANAFMKIQEVNQKAQGQMMQVIEDADFNPERFNAMYASAMNPAQAAEVNATAEETQKFQQIVERMEAMQPVFQKQMEEAVVKEGITVERFEQLAATLETDPAMQQRLQTMMMQ